MDEPVVVIGSGPCGAIAASELVRRGVSVTLLEAGSAAPTGVLVRIGGNTVFRYVRDPMESARHVVSGGDPTTQWYSSLSLGGLSNYWTAAVPRFDPRDFDDGARLDERFRWPVTYDDLAPWYAAVEQHLSVTGGDPIMGLPENVLRFRRELPGEWRDLAERASAMGYPFGILPMATGRPTMAVRRPTGWNSWHCVVKPLVGRAGFALRRGARVLRLLWSAREGRATAVEYLDVATGERSMLPCRAVMLAAGALDSTRVLLQSRSSDFPDGIGNSHGLVGRYLHDHPKQWWPVTFDRALPLLAHPAYLPRADHASRAPLMGSSHTIGMVGTTTRVKAWARMRSTIAGVQVFGTMVPEPDHTALIDRHDDLLDESDAPLRLSIRYDAQASRNIVDARERLTEAFSAMGVSATSQGPFYDLCPGTSVHYAGTVRMHADPVHGVLDAWNRTHDAPNVAVVDLSCFTTNPEKNPTLTAMALAARAANRLADDLSTSRLY